MISQDEFYSKLESLFINIEELTGTVKRIEEELKEFHKQANVPVKAETVEEVVVEPTGEQKKVTRKKKVVLNEEGK